jgi:hypothetical protein
MPVMPPGYDSENGYFGGALFRARAGIRGKPEFRADVRAPSAEESGAI